MNIDRRDFLRSLTAGGITLALGAEEITARAQAKPAPKPAGPPVTVAVIGTGAQGQEILKSLAQLGAGAPVAMLCDTFDKPVFMKKAQAIAPNAAFVNDYRKVLDNKVVQAVFIATPTHKHKQIALDAIAAGKHVYCEAPLASDLAEAKAIAQAGKAASTIFQPGLQQRCNLQNAHVYHFVLISALGKPIYSRAQYHKRTTWRRVWPTPEREQELNWRLNKATSAGLFAEVAIHQLDTAAWFMRQMPTAITANGAIMEYNDGRDVFDTVQGVFEFPKARFAYDASLSTSFEDVYELFMGAASSIMLRDQRAWMFKEADAAPLGWEVFARKDVHQIGKPENGSGINLGAGIALVADASKQLAMGKQELTVDPTKTSLFQAVDIFIQSVRAGKRVPVKEPTQDDPRPPLSPSAQEGFNATVLALKANEAAVTGNRIVVDKEWFTL